MRMQVKIMFALIAVFAMVSTAAPQEAMKDSRDGKTYKTVKIGSQIWMAENLNYKTTNSYCYDNAPANCSKYGRLYTWSAAMEACPSGWHLPSRSEFETLFKTVGGKSEAGKMLKSKTGWRNRGNGTDAYSFSALPAGQRSGDGEFDFEDVAHFWSSAEDDRFSAYYMALFHGLDTADLYYSRKHNGVSVRCLRD